MDLIIFLIQGEALVVSIPWMISLVSALLSEELKIKTETLHFNEGLHHLLF